MRTGFFCTLAMLASALLAAAAPSRAADINLIGVFGNKATLMVDGGKPRTLSVGETTPEKMRLISVGADSAVVDFGGRRETLRLGNQRISNTRADGGTQRVMLTGDARGHFVTTVQINGVSMQFLVDTGATSVTLSAEDAKRANIAYTSGERVRTQTANGIAMAYRVTLNTVRLGEITLHNVEGIVMEGNALGRQGLLGMSFLSRTDIKREGDTLTLVKRF
ncbi:MAG: TIGR02281 family clan AA aspartic protease [Betaproteobacteria bacterium]|nr:TIGR02281 family clan AA aspartic protease [Betaproteobacteria bacterium]